MEVPDEDCVYLVGDQPVIVAWAHHRNTTAPPTGVLATLAPRAAPLAPPITPIAEPAGGDTPPTEKSPRRRRWWWLVWTRTEVYTIRRGPTWGWLWWLLWITAGVLAALIAWVLLTACGTSWLIPLDYCPRAEVVAAVPEADRRDGLEAELYRLQRQLNQQDLACVPPPPAPVAEPPSNEFDTRVQQEGGQTNAALRITLIWDTLSDLDLHLYCPGGGHLFYRSRTACGGILDIDKNVRNPTNTPVENIVFTTSPPPGTYRIRVYNYTQVGRSTNNYKLQIVKNGEMSVKSGSLSRGGTGADFTFTVP